MSFAVSGNFKGKNKNLNLHSFKINTNMVCRRKKKKKKGELTPWKDQGWAIQP